MHSEPARGEAGWAIAREPTWSYKPALLATIVAIILFPALFLLGWLPSRNGPTVVYPATRDQLVGPTGATLGQPAIPPAGTGVSKP